MNQVIIAEKTNIINMELCVDQIKKYNCLFISHGFMIKLECRNCTILRFLVMDLDNRKH